MLLRLVTTNAGSFEIKQKAEVLWFVTLSKNVKVYSHWMQGTNCGWLQAFLVTKISSEPRMASNPCCSLTTQGKWDIQRLELNKISDGASILVLQHCLTFKCKGRGWQDGCSCKVWFSGTYMVNGEKSVFLKLSSDFHTLGVVHTYTHTYLPK